MERRSLSLRVTHLENPLGDGRDGSVHPQNYCLGVRAGVLDGPAICRMFNQAIAGELARPRHLSSDHDPLFEFHRWKANLRILNVTEIKTVPEVPLSNPFVERLVGTIRRELLDQIPFWSAQDLERKLLHFRDYYNRDRIHASLGGVTPDCKAGDVNRRIVASASISGTLTAAACISYPWLRDPQFATDSGYDWDWEAADASFRKGARKTKDSRPRRV